jgi:hypothetical protein
VPRNDVAKSVESKWFNLSRALTADEAEAGVTAAKALSEKTTFSSKIHLRLSLETAYSFPKPSPLPSLLRLPLLPTRSSHLLPERVVAIQEGARIKKINTSNMREEMLDLPRQDRDGEVAANDAVAPLTARAMRVGEDELG